MRNGETGVGRKGGKGAGQGGEQTGKAECRKAERRESEKQGKDDWRKKRQIYRRQEAVRRTRRGKGDR